MGNLPSRLFQKPELLGPGVQMFSVFQTTSKNREQWAEITTEFLESTREHHVSEHNLSYRCSTKVGDPNTTSTLEVYADAGGVAVHGVHVQKLMQKIKEDNIQIPYGSVAAPACEMEPLKVLGIPVYRWLDGAFIRPRALDKSQSFIHILSEWTVKDQSATEEAILTLAGGNRDGDDPDFEEGQLFYGGAVHEDSLLISEAYASADAVKAHLDRTKQLTSKFSDSCTGNWSRVYCSSDQLPALKQMLADGWFRSNGVYKSPDFYVLDERSFALWM